MKKSENNPTLLQKTIKYSQKDVDKSGYAPITKNYINNGMSVSKLCEAALDYSDNTAMNILINQLGGINSVNAYARSINDNTFRLDRQEPELNTAIPGDVRDTTTPKAMGNSLQHLVLKDALKLPEREKLISWLKNNTTGNSKIRAGVPKGWVVGDKTGSGDYGTRNDIGIIYPPKCSPLVVVVYTTQNKKNTISHDEVIESATNMLINEFANTNQCLKQNL